MRIRIIQNGCPIAKAEHSRKKPDIKIFDLRKNPINGMHVATGNFKH